MGLWHSVVAGLSIFGANSCNGVLDHNVVHIGTAAEIRHIKLMSFASDRVAKMKFEARKLSEKDYSISGIMPFYSSMGAVDVGMENVPVLDQGSEGTCVTFSTTAALDALVGLNDFISQECSLALDLSLGQNYWDGADMPSQIIMPLQTYGVVQQEVCPFKYPDSDATINIDDYQKKADLYASNRVRAAQFQYYPQASLATVKSSLAAGKRVLMAFMLNPNYQQAIQGFDIKIDGWSHTGGLFACKQGRSPNYCAKSSAGHEVVIIGYDDKQELLKIRNSWGSSFGDLGDYYMTYSFFSQMAVDLTVVY